MPQFGQAAGRTRSPNQAPDPSSSLTVAMLASAIPKPSDMPIPSAAATPTLCFEAQISAREMMRQFS